MQVAFLKGRRSSDNVIIVQELIYSLKSRRGKDGYMVIKIDLEKAYDRLEWSFVKIVLDHFGFPQEIINLIMSCISTSTIALLFNGSKLEAFQPSRGIRQGDPISPYLFLLCMEFLGAQITSMCKGKRWDRMKASRNGPSFSHVFFADDLKLFTKANHKNCEAVIEVLDNFCNLAGQKVNLGKSKILFSPNVPRRRKRFICRKLGMTSTNNLGRYLGFPLLTQGRAGDAYYFIVERVQNKLAGWRTTLLSRAGKLVLVRSVAAPIAEYFMQCQVLPSKVCEGVDKTIRDFLWGSTEEKRKMHMVKWRTVTLPKDLEGLGLQSIKDRNLAILAKLCWRLVSANGSPWVAMLSAKYLTPNRLTKEGKNLPYSSIWTACKKGGPFYAKGLKWAMRNGGQINF